MYEVFEHTADLGLRISSPTLNGLFSEAAEALFSVIVENIDQIRTEKSFKLNIKASNLEYLLFDWLNELLYLFESEKIVANSFLVNVDSDSLSAEVYGEVLDRNRHKTDHEVKAITYHQLKVVQKQTEWMAEVILDI
ncbi:MAG: archease [Blastocatellia bacterium]|nr:archease [Blastocatellia bacterium]